MSSIITRLAVIALIGAGLSGCASSGDSDMYGEAPPVRVSSMAPLPSEHGSNHVEAAPGQAPLQCVPYAREHSPIKIFGDAYTWWDQASGKYERGPTPAAGTVMVLNNYAGPERGHVAVVRRVVSAREIRVDHANWLDDGAIYVNDPVVDVSAGNDWSAVRVWNIKTGGWGGKIYPVQGFIGSGSASVPDGSDSETPKADDQRETPRDNDDDAAPSPDDLIASLAQDDVSPPPPAKSRMTIVNAARAPQAPFMTVNAGAGELNPPADSPHALSAQDLALP